MNIDFVKSSFGYTKLVLVRKSDGNIDGVCSTRQSLKDRIAKKGYAEEDYEILTVRQYEKKYIKK